MHAILDRQMRSGQNPSLQPLHALTFPFKLPFMYRLQQKVILLERL